MYRIPVPLASSFPLLPMLPTPYTTNVMSPEEWDILDAACPKFQEASGFPLMREGPASGGMVALIRTGSAAYGTSTPASDLDYTAVVLPDRRTFFGFRKWDAWEPGPDDTIDVKAISLAKFVWLAVQGNPNLVEMLFFPQEQFRYISPVFRPFLHIRDSFLSRETFKRFSGYAMGQFKKMESGKKENHMGHKRFEIVKQLGYDPKDASHLMRLLYSGRELAHRGTLTPRLQPEHAEVVISIKKGEWDLDTVKHAALTYATENERLFNLPSCPLPSAPDTVGIEQTLMRVQQEGLSADYDHYADVAASMFCTPSTRVSPSVVMAAPFGGSR